MRSRVFLTGLAALAILGIAGPASAKVDIAKANITGPGLAEEIRIRGREAQGLWQSGIDVVGGTDDARAGSVFQLALTPADLGPRYVVTYRFFGDDSIRQDLYPFATGGPVTYTPPEQDVAEGQPWGGAITAGWYQASPAFFDYLVDQGLPEKNPVLSVATHNRPPGTAPGAQKAPWTSIVAVLVALAVLSLPTLATRRRAVATALD